MQRILSKSSLPQDQQDLHKYLANKEHKNTEKSCPICKDIYLKEYIVDSVKIELCPNCEGLFFDKGELNKIAPDVKRENKHDLNYEELPYGTTGHYPFRKLDIFDEKGEDINSPRRKPIGPWQAVGLLVLFLMFWLVRACIQET